MRLAAKSAAGEGDRPARSWPGKRPLQAGDSALLARRGWCLPRWLPASAMKGSEFYTDYLYSMMLFNRSSVMNHPCAGRTPAPGCLPSSGTESNFQEDARYVQLLKTFISPFCVFFCSAELQPRQLTCAVKKTKRVWGLPRCRD